MFHLPFWKEIFLLAIYKKKKKTALSQRKKAHSLKLKKCFFHLRLRNWRNIFKESQHYHTMGAGSLNFFSTLWTNRSHFVLDYTHLQHIFERTLQSFTLSKNYKWNYAVLAHFPWCAVCVSAFAVFCSHSRLFASRFFSYIFFYIQFFIPIPISIHAHKSAIRRTSFMHTFFRTDWMSTMNTHKKEKMKEKKKEEERKREKRIEPDALVKIFPSQRFETFVREMLFWRTLKLRSIKNRSKNMQLKFQWNMLLIGSKRALSSFVNKVLHQTQWAREWESERSTLNISPIKWKPSLCIQCQFSLPSCSLFNII